MPGSGIEEVQRNLVGVELAELDGEFSALLERLSHPDDAATADLHAHLPHQLQRLPAFVPRVRGDDLREVRAGGLEIVVVPVHAEVPQILGLRASEDAQRAGDVDLDRLLDRRHALADLRHQPRVGPPHGGDDAELGGACGGGLPGRLHQRRDVQASRANRSVEPARLRAEMTVLGAAPGLDRDDPLNLDLGTAPPHPHLVGERECLGHAVVRQLEHGQDLLPAEPKAARQDLPARLVEDVVRHRYTSRSLAGEA